MLQGQGNGHYHDNLCVLQGQMHCDDVLQITALACHLEDVSELEISLDTRLERSTTNSCQHSSKVELALC